jgi:ABC-type transport system involved in multi-copper enzyme maturation permease subunit
VSPLPILKLISTDQPVPAPSPAPVTGGGANPFGWTGIKRERYTKWSGHLDGRQKIVTRMIGESVRFNIKTVAVVVVIVLGWLFSMLFPVLMAASGVLSLEAENPSTWDGTQAAQVGMHRWISNDTAVEYPLRGSYFTNRTEFATINIPMGWAAYVNATTDDSGTRASLFVIPPAEAPPMATASIQVRATTGRRVDYFTTVSMIAPTPMMVNQTRAYELSFEQVTYEVRAGDAVNVAFDMKNTGTVADSYNVTINTLPDDWRISTYVDGNRVSLKSRQVRLSGGPPGGGPGDRFFSITVRYFQLELQPGQTAQCSLNYETATDSAKANAISLTIGSRSDPIVGGGYSTQVKLTDTKKMDLTGKIIFGQVMSTQTFFALLLAAVVGSRMIATDLQEKSYNLYFARPMSKKDYLVGKFGTVGTLLGMITILPTLLTYLLLILLSTISSTYVVDHLWVWGAIIGYGLVVVITMSTLSLAFSSLTNRRFYAAAALVVIYLVTSIVGQIATTAFNSDYGKLAGINDNLNTVGSEAFGLGDSLALKFPWEYSVLVLATIWAVCTFLVWYKVERTELSE